MGNIYHHLKSEFGDYIHQMVQSGSHCGHSKALQVMQKSCSTTAISKDSRSRQIYPAGAHNEFVFVGRLDNLAMSFCSTRALVDAFPDEASLKGEAAVKAVALFDHEEVGSSSAQGAAPSHPLLLSFPRKWASLDVWRQKGSYLPRGTTAQDEARLRRR